MSIWGTPSGRVRRWGRRRHFRVPVPLYARLAILAASVAVGGALAWHTAEVALRPRSSDGSHNAGAAGSAAATPSQPPWQRDALDSMEDGIRSATAGNITAAEVAVDRAGSVIEAARVQMQPVDADFFEIANSKLDLVLRQNPDNSRLLEHVTMARVNLAQLRSAVEGAHGSGASSQTSSATRTAGAVEETEPVAAAPGSSSSASGARKITIAAPKEIEANHILDPQTLGGDTIDATLMPDTAEILLPPSSRLFVDNVRVEDLTLEGASQTLDGIHWKNVIFVGTRLRYEGGELDLRNVRFIRCTFGLTTDERGARLANAIALGQTSIVIN